MKVLKTKKKMMWSFCGWTILALKDLRIKRVILETSCSASREVLLQPNRFPAFRSIIESIMLSLQYFESWSLEHVVPERNQVAGLIATSVTRDHRYQSYVARGGPFWLQSIINKEATGVWGFEYAPFPFVTSLCMQEYLLVSLFLLSFSVSNLFFLPIL